jgi:adenosylcobinamide-GDP ribazoletransferase
MLTALRSAVGLLTRVPSEGEADWAAVRTTPLVVPVLGVVVGLVAGVTLLVPAPLATPPALYLGTLYLLTGTAGLAGLASLVDSAAPEHDGGVVAVVLVVVALALGAFSLVGTGGGGLGGLAGASITLSLVVASEVAAKAGLATLLARGVGSDDDHEAADATALLPVVVVLLLVVALVPAVARPAVVATLVAGVLVALVVGAWARGQRGEPVEDGVDVPVRGPSTDHESAVSNNGPTTGDVLGAANELGRVVAVHAGVVVWTVV